jgi:hypothetical protein
MSNVNAASTVATMIKHAECLISAIKVADSAMNSTFADGLYGRLDAIDASISHMQPQSIGDALYQIGLIRKYAEQNEAEADAAIERMTYAVADFLETMDASRRRWNGGDFYLPPQLDPRPLSRRRGRAGLEAALA